MEVKEEKGSISIHTENIFPIIKKFLYSDHEIFLRELVSNSVDACQKLKKLSSLGEIQEEIGAVQVQVSINKEAKTITISDNGIGMTAEEIKKYINQIAFSGATEFVEKYKGISDTKEIIGQFGLGFYSAFMVASNVEIHTKSWQPGALAARWICDGSTEFEISKSEKAERGTDIILHVAEDSEEFLDNFRLKGILTKYCKFLPVEVKFEEDIINNSSPIWTKSPSELTEEDYKNFYRELYPMAEDPLFWIHLNVDYPFNLTGVLYFPKLKGEFEPNKNKIQLYSRQVFITDEVKDVVPEFLMLLHGVIDSPDIPLNVSRSFLQSDGNVKKINTHITKKVADKLAELYNNDVEGFKQKWDDIGLFVKYGMISDDKFYEKAKDFCLYKNTANEYYSFEQYKEKVSVLQKDKSEQLVIIYTTDKNKQDAYIRSANKRGYDVLLLDGPLDSHFVGLVERKAEKTTLKRVDSDTVEKLIDKDEKIESILTEDQNTKVKEIFEKAVNDKTRTVQLESISPEELPVTIVLPEFFRRMKDMAAYGGMAFGGKMPEQLNVVINSNHKLIQKVISESNEEEQVRLARQAYDLALLGQGMLTGGELTTFIERSVGLIN